MNGWMNEFGFVYMYVYAYCCIFSDREQVSDGMEGSCLFVFICCWSREEGEGEGGGEGDGNGYCNG